MSILLTNRNIRLIKKVPRQDRDFSNRLNFANEKIREIWMNMVNTNYNSAEDMINELQQLIGKTKLKFHKNISSYYDERKHRNFQTQEDPFSKMLKVLVKRIMKCYC